jgi:hypothetical protein
MLSKLKTKVLGVGTGIGIVSELRIIVPILKLVWSITFNSPFKIVLAISSQGSENLCLQSQKYFIKSF